jgi:hypothetical protein
MSNAAFYRQEAQRCRASALAAEEPDAAVRWLRIAKDYDTLAAAMTAEELKLSAVGLTQPGLDGP